ncbi:MAG: chorismate synthase [Candidatus Margulisbacteria bacterium]|jgi:chorismate synthase|nr:chorismate synthase [Candidatus Margulisiibacteriota bacterium]
MLRYLTAGESHGAALVAILDGCPANLALSADDLDLDLARRQGGYGRGARMKLEKDKVEILSGVRKGKTIGSPIALLIPNKSTEFFNKVITALRPGHADLAGALKYNQADVRNILERASARETAARVAVGGVARALLGALKIRATSRVVEIGGHKERKEWQQAIDRARAAGDSVGGIFEVIVTGVPAGLGSYVQWDRRLDGNLARALMAIPAIKGVEIGLGFEAAKRLGSKVHDELYYVKRKGFYHQSNNAGGLEGGISNGEPIVIRAAMKPIATLGKPLQSVDLATKKATAAYVERADVCAVEAAAVIGESAALIEVANALLEKCGGDSMEELKTNLAAYQKQVSVL